MENEKLKRLEARVVQLENEVRQLREERERPQLLAAEKVQQPSVVEKPPVQPQPKQKKEPIDWETVIGKVWLPRIFIFVLLLGVVWGFVIAVEAGWLTETARIVIGFITAGLFYFIGDKQIKQDRVALGKVLLVGFIATLLVTTFAMHILYGMIPSGIAFFLNVIWVGLGIYLSDLHRSQAMGIMFVIAGYLTDFRKKSPILKECEGR